MPDQTNISDFDPATGRTTTTLVATHTRGSLEEATRDGQEHSSWHRADMPSAAGDPSITSLSPSHGPAAGGAFTVTVNGSHFVAGSVIEINQQAKPTTYVSATKLTTSYDPTVAGTAVFSVRNPNAEESNTVGFTVTATAITDDPSQLTVDEVKAWVEEHPDDAPAVLAAEQARGGEARSTLVTWLQSKVGQ